MTHYRTLGRPRERAVSERLQLIPKAVTKWDQWSILTGARGQHSMFFALALAEMSNSHIGQPNRKRHPDTANALRRKKGRE